MTCFGRAVEDAAIVARIAEILEQQAGPATLHPAEVRHAIAVATWRAARSL